ncbi:otogelin-like protein [Cynoglossus semilaevis]|uniref:otogelin-like protein n=1 Tax=Cynoglossus semilaevis TaxID=244447 RepID=UPI000D630D83|nr:otogelin-like protein [Cynoglossus semilaevis]
MFRLDMCLQDSEMTLTWRVKLFLFMSLSVFHCLLIEGARSRLSLTERRLQRGVNALRRKRDLLGEETYGPLLSEGTLSRTILHNYTSRDSSSEHCDCLNGGWCQEGGLCDCTQFQALGDRCQIIPNQGQDRDGICRSWGQHHYETFDGIYFYFPGTCSYILAQDCHSSTPQYTVWVHNSRVCDGSVYSCARALSLFFPNEEEIYISGYQVHQGGRRLILPQTIGSVFIERLADYLLVKSAFGFSLAWDGGSGVYLKMSEEHQDSSCGLCGNFNHFAGDDLLTARGIPTDEPAVFANSWAVDLPHERACPSVDLDFTGPCQSESDINDAIEKCSALLFFPFLSCHENIDPNPFVASCISDLCISDDEETFCRALVEYTRACSHVGYPVREWRDSFPSCNDGCEDSFVYRDCISCCPPTCRTNLHCLDGCYCPDGLILQNGTCIAVSQCPCVYHGTSYMQGHELHQGCSVCVCFGGVWNCTENNCTVVLDEDVSRQITLTRDGEVIIGVNPASVLPYTDDTVEVRKLTSVFVQLKVADGLRLQYDSQGGRVYLQLHSKWRGQTLGLCGTFNGNLRDDFLSPAGMIEGTPQLHANAWKVSSACAAPVNLPVIDPCEMNQNNVYYASQCDTLMGSVFAPCHGYISPNIYQQQCRYQSCRCGSSCLCTALAHYTYLCSKHGVVVDFRSQVSECGAVCLGGMLYHSCVSFCGRSCRALSDYEECDSADCAEGCGCPESTFYDDVRQRCVQKSQCHCYTMAGAFQPGEVSFSASGPCLCKDGKLECISEEKEPEEVGECQEGKVYNSCIDQRGGMACAPTCRNLMLNLTCPPNTPCIPGCVCPPGLLLHHGKCYYPENCPCAWLGLEYLPGETIETLCYKCVCHRGYFNCSYSQCPSVCTIYSDRHYHTFDGLEYDYYSDCQVYLLKSTGDTEVSIVAQNKDCYESGIVCRKLLIIHVGLSKIYFTDNSGNPSPSTVVGHGSEFELWKAGYYTVVQFSNQDLTILWDRKTTVHIRVGPQWKGRLGGLCGNFDGITVNDMSTSSHMEVSNAQAFGDSWTLGQCESDYVVERPCERDLGRQPYAKRECALLYSDVFAPCHNVVDVGWFYRNCLTDTCNCNRGGDCECLCTSIAAYAHKCCQQGVTIHWRSPSVCPYDCEYYNRELGDGPFSLASASFKDTMLGVNRTSGTVFPLTVERPGQLPASGLLFNFMITAGLHRDRTSRVPVVSLESAERPNFFLAISGRGPLHLEHWSQDADFSTRATFIQHQGLFQPGHTSFELFSQPGTFLTLTHTSAQPQRYDTSDTFRTSSSFTLEESSFVIPYRMMCEWRYQPCANPCVRTCRDPDAKLCQFLPLVEGCFPRCPKTMVLDEVTRRCVYPDDCVSLPPTSTPFAFVTRSNRTTTLSTPATTTTTTITTATVTATTATATVTSTAAKTDTTLIATTTRTTTVTGTISSYPTDRPTTTTTTTTTSTITPTAFTTPSRRITSSSTPSPSASPSAHLTTHTPLETTTVGKTEVASTQTTGVTTTTPFPEALTAPSTSLPHTILTTTTLPSTSTPVTITTKTTKPSIASTTLPLTLPTTTAPTSTTSLRKTTSTPQPTTKDTTISQETTATSAEHATTVGVPTTTVDDAEPTTPALLSKTEASTSFIFPTTPCIPPYSHRIDECAELICFNGELLLHNSSLHCRYNTSQPHCSLLGLPILINTDPCCPLWQCPCRCTVMSDLRVITFDGNNAALYDNGSYILVNLPRETIIGSVEKCPTSQSVNSIRRPSPTGGTSGLCFKKLNITTSSYRIIINRLERKVTVNYRPVSLPFSRHFLHVEDTGSMYLIHTSHGIDIQWYHSTGIMVLQYKTLHNGFVATQGLCGCCDGNPEDDLKLPNGTVIKDVGDMMLFLQSWSVYTTDEIEHTRKVGANCTTGDCSTCLSMLHQRTFSPCHSKVSPEQFCDIMWAGDLHYKDHQCDFLAAYVAVCYTHQICINWRRHNFCPLQCPPGKEYQPCVSTCASRTCLNREYYDETSCSFIREECVCRSGTILHRPDSPYCVTEDRCVCTDNEGNPRAPGEVWNGSSRGCCLYKCAENGSVVAVEPECNSFPTPLCEREGEYVLDVVEEGACCPKKICECNMTVCDREVPPCENGNRLVIGYSTLSCCPEYRCECDPMACPPISPPHCRQDQFLVEVRGHKSCCYSYLCVCESCTEPIPSCSHGEILSVDLNTTNSCCPQYYCVCDVNLCPESSVSCAAGLSLVQTHVPGLCCPQYHCGTHKQTLISKLPSILDVLLFYISSGLGSLPFTVNPLTPTGSTNCDTVQFVLLSFLFSSQVTVYSCDGKCPSATIFNFNINSHARFCKCCRENGLQTRSVTLYCSRNSTVVEYNFQEPLECTCQWH